MAKYRYFILFLVLFPAIGSCNTGNKNQSPGSGADRVNDSLQILLGAEQHDKYIPKLMGKRVGVVANQTSLVMGVHLIDVLISKGINVTGVFAPEHGFRGEAGPGDKIDSGKDVKTGLPVISLYGSKKHPLPADLQNMDVIVFDIQDVGARFYTYISTLHYVMEACAENRKKVLVLDRPNPNGFYIDGPVLDTAYRSFVGVAPIPVVHGLTVGEYAMMANGEGWLRNGVKCDLEVIAMENYNHSRLYELPVKPSPNLPDMVSIYLYQSLCFFEGAKVSVGRGTEFPFKVYGFPGYKEGTLKFTPVDIPGVITNPPYKDQMCSARDLRNEWKPVIAKKQIMVEWIIEMYHAYPDKDTFFNNFFDKLAGTHSLRMDIVNRKSAADIRKSWEADLVTYKIMRARYLLYPD